MTNESIDVKMSWLKRDTQSVQIIATSYDLTVRKVADEGKSFYFRENSRLVKYYAVVGWGSACGEIL